MHVAKTLTYPVESAYLHFWLHYAITIHQHYRQTDGQTDIHHAFSTSVTCYAIYMLAACGAKKSKTGVQPIFSCCVY